MPVGTGAISLTDVTTEIAGTQTSLQDCVNDHDPAGLDGTYYTAPLDSLADFRGYDDSPVNVTISPTSFTTPFSAATSFGITVTVTNGPVSWTATDNQTWITLSGTTSSTTSGSFTVNLTANGGGSTRFGTVTVSWSPGPNRTCSVAQGTA